MFLSATSKISSNSEFLFSTLKEQRTHFVEQELTKMWVYFDEPIFCFWLVCFSSKTFQNNFLKFVDIKSLTF